MAVQEPIEQYETVRVWCDDCKKHWADCPEEEAVCLEVLRRFCQFVGKDPDTIIAECLRAAAGGKKISIKGRRFYDDKIREFQASLEGDPRQKARLANRVRSFLIHNGVFLQSGIQLR